MSLAETPEAFPENPHNGKGLERDDVLSAVLEAVRLSGSVQFCFMPGGDWQTDASPSLAKQADPRTSAVPFHIVAEGNCWVRVGNRQTDLEAGDIILFPWGTGHQLGAGTNGALVLPANDLPPKPWREVPVLRYGHDDRPVRLLCGYLQCDALGFSPLRQALPEFIHVKARASGAAAGLDATVRRMVDEIDCPRAGGVSMLRRLTEIVFVEILRDRIVSASPGSTGWLAALADPALVRCLSLVHDDPRHEWSLGELAAASGMSRSALADRFRSIMGTSTVRYLREWRLHLASIELATTERSIADIGWEAGYASEAAFYRAFSRAYGIPPAAWRSRAKA